MCVFEPHTASLVSYGKMKSQTAMKVQNAYFPLFFRDPGNTKGGLKLGTVSSRGRHWAQPAAHVLLIQLLES
jgi:hypothetical protein